MKKLKNEGKWDGRMEKSPVRGRIATDIAIKFRFLNCYELPKRNNLDFFTLLSGKNSKNENVATTLLSK